MSRPFDNRPAGRLDAMFRQAPELTEADVKATIEASERLFAEFTNQRKDQT